jgi:4-amino-4-deoxy-L-arabinose transferase-like glycosyltransferase
MTVTKISERVFAVGFTVIVVLLACCAIALIAFSGIKLWHSVLPSDALTLANRFDLILDCIAMLTIAMASMELAHTVVEEEFNSEARLNASARARRVLSRFLVVVIVSLSIESLVAVFKLVDDDPSRISEGAYIAFAAAALLAAWGFFIRMGQRGEARGD